VEYIDLVKLQEQLDGDTFRILSSIGPRTLHVDEIIAESGLNASVVLPALTMLELDGFVEQTAGNISVAVRASCGLKAPA
jgi:predicted Rossmann fold nucleotide-binding protein DprA/Smf involved in DNA uptake